MEKFICKYCGKECKNKNSLAQHEIRCKENPNKISFISNFIKYNNSKHKGTNQFIKAKELGLPIPIVSKETKEKQAKAWLGKKHSEEQKNNISKGIQKAILEHPESYSSSKVNGRVKKKNYNGIIVDSSWEVIVAEYLDRNNIKWERVNKGIKYFWEGKYHYYFPDFYLPDLNYYIEVKGYQRDRDLYKWKSINNLIIIKKNEINDIENNIFNIYSFIN